MNKFNNQIIFFHVTTPFKDGKYFPFCVTPKKNTMNAKPFFSLISIILLSLSCDPPSQQGNGQYGGENQPTNDISYECNVIREQVQNLQNQAAEYEQAAERCEPGSVSQMSYWNNAQQARNQVEEYETWLYNNCN